MLVSLSHNTCRAIGAVLVALCAIGCGAEPTIIDPVPGITAILGVYRVTTLLRDDIRTVDVGLDVIVDVSGTFRVSRYPSPCRLSGTASAGQMSNIWAIISDRVYKTTGSYCVHTEIGKHYYSVGLLGKDSSDVFGPRCLDHETVTGKAKEQADFLIGLLNELSAECRDPL